MADFRNEIKAYIEKEIAVLKSINIDEIDESINELLKTYESDSNIYIFGNGGSASTASHFTNDFNKGISEYVNKKFNFICLNDNVPTVLAIANDVGYDQIYKFQLEGRLKKNDLVIGISGSGNSANIINALKYAKKIGAKSMGVTGYFGGEVLKISDFSLHVPIENMQIAEDVHMMFDHMIMTILCNRIEDREIKF